MNGAAATLGLYHPTALVESGNVGEGTRIWAFAHVLSGAVIGRDCNICDHTFVENDVIVGDRVTIKCGVQLWDGVRLMDDVFVGPNATFTNDPFPRSGQHQDPMRMPRTLVKRGASIGANATILPGITIGEQAMVGAGSVVTRDVPAETVVAGNPAAIIGYAGAVNRRPAAPKPIPTSAGCVDTSVHGVVLRRLSRVEDLRGHLSFGETNQEVPFEVRRYFVVFGVSGKHIRGEHAHHRTHQFLVCVAGSCHVVADDGESREEFVLDEPSMGLFLPAMTWAVQYKYSPDAVLMVLASEHYDAHDYIRSYDEFRVLRRRAVSAEAGA